MRKHTLAASLLGFAALCTAATAKAETFAFTASGIGYSFSASGTLTGVADPTVAGAYDITSATGFFNTVPFTLYPSNGANATTPVNVTLGTNSPYTYDNVILTDGGPSLDLYGLLFADGTDDTNFYFDGNSYFFTNNENVNGSDVTSFPITFSVTDTTPAAVTPEPSSIALLGTGLLGLGGILRKRIVS